MKSRRLLPGLFLILLFLTALPDLYADYKLAVAYYNQGNYQKAIDELTPDMAANPNWEFGHRLIGLSYLALKNNSLAITSLTRAVQLKSTTPSVYIGLAQAYYNLNRFDKCMETVNQGEPLAKDQDRYKLYRLRGSTYFQMKKYPETISDINAALRAGTGDWSDYWTLGVSYYRIEQTEEAVQALTKALAGKPDHTASAELLGKCYFKQGITALATKQYENALNLFRLSAERNPKDAYAYYNMAEALLFLKQYTEAEKALQQAIALNPQNSEAHQRLGLIYEKQKKWTLALTAYQKAEAIKPSAASSEAIKRLKAAKKP